MKMTTPEDKRAPARRNGVRTGVLCRAWLQPRQESCAAQAALAAEATPSEHADTLRRLGPAALCALALTVLMAGMLATAPAAAQKQKKIAASSVFVPDKGKLKILLDGQPVGTEEFEISPSGDGWTAKGTTDVRVPDGSRNRVTAALEFRADGTPKAYEWTSQGEKKNSAHVVFDGGNARIVLEMEGTRPFQQELTYGTPLVVVLDNNLYHHYEIFAHVYNWEKKGAQTFPVLIPQDMTPGTITAEATGSQSVDGKTYEGLRVATADLEVMLYLDSGHRLMRLDVPAAKASVLRE